MYRNDLSRLTLVIPTYTRQAYALRNMRYWSGRGPVVHVLDGSPDAIAEPELRVLEANIHYHHLPVGINERLSFVLNLIDTEYTALLSDDEFFIPSALAACIAELDVERDMVACGGRSLWFSQSIYGVVGGPAYITQTNYAVTMNDPVERMIYHMRSYTCSTIYAVLRFEAWARIIRIMVQKEFSVYAMGEIQFELAACCLGKSKVIQSLMWLRSRENPQLTGTSISLNPNNRIWDWWGDFAYAQEHIEFIELMSNGLTSSANEIPGLRDGVVQAIDAYVDACRYDVEKNGIHSLLTFVRFAIPKNLKEILKLVVFPYRYIKGDSAPLLTAAKEISQSGVTVDFDELANTIIPAIKATKHLRRR